MDTASILMVARWQGDWGEWGRSRGLRCTNWCLQNSHRDDKYSIGNGVAIELIPMTRGHEQSCGACVREWGVLGGRGKGGKTRTTVIATSIKYNLKNKSLFQNY